jgi:hypothetical protein
VNLNKKAGGGSIGKRRRLREKETEKNKWKK